MGGFCRSLFRTASLYTPFRIIPQIIYLRHTFCRSGFIFWEIENITSARQNGAFKATMNVHIVRKLHLRLAQIVNELRMFRQRSVCLLQAEIQLLLSLENWTTPCMAKSFILIKRLVHVHTHQDRIFLFLVHVNNGFGISDQPS